MEAVGTKRTGCTRAPLGTRGVCCRCRSFARALLHVAMTVLDEAVAVDAAAALVASALAAVAEVAAVARAGATAVALAVAVAVSVPEAGVVVIIIAFASSC